MSDFLLQLSFTQIPFTHHPAAPSPCSCTYPNGTAALGGLLVDRISFEATFRITAIVYVVATLILALVIPLTAGEKVDESPGKADSASKAQSKAESEAGSSTGAAAKLSPKAQKGYGTGAEAGHVAVAAKTRT